MSSTVLTNFVGELNARYGRGDMGITQSEWITKYTKLKDVPFSFVDHEFQQEIVNDDSQQIVCRKCAQVGLSEVMVRDILAFLARNQGLTAIMTQPTRKNALDFSTTRIDDMIKESQLLHAMLDTKVDSKELKRLGKSYLYVKGTIGAKSAISVPADMLIHDELDFSDLEIINKYSSRVQHSKFKYFRKFSTPTIPNFGISKEFNVSSQKHYLMKCPHCNHWNYPDFFKDVVINNPKYSDKELKDLTHDDLAYIQPDQVLTLCSHCRKPVSYHDYTSRKWVAKYEGRAIAGYQVSPFNTPFQDPYNLLKMMNTYTHYADFVNFALGMDYIDDNMIFDLAKYHDKDHLDPNHAFGLFIGVDFGKQCWLTVAQQLPDGKVLVYLAEEVPQEMIVSRVKDCIRNYHISGMCVDALPQTLLSREIIALMPDMAYTVYYSDSQKDLYVIKGNELDVTVARTQLFDTVLRIPKLVVSDNIDHKVYKVHLQGMVKQRDQEDEHKHRYVKVKEDHLLHSLGYAMLAQEIFGDSTDHIALPTIGSTHIK